MGKLFILLVLLIPVTTFSQGNLDLTVYNYMFVDSLGNNYSEKEHSAQGITGNYDKLAIRTHGDVTTFTFNLRQDCKRRTETNTEETYSYRVLEKNIEGDMEYWVLMRSDGARLVFDNNKTLNSYSLTIPADERGEELYIYIFTKSQ